MRLRRGKGVDGVSTYEGLRETAEVQLRPVYLRIDGGSATPLGLGNVVGRGRESVSQIGRRDEGRERTSRCKMSARSSLCSRVAGYLRKT